jgi:quinol monooxygenase YgiN
MFGTVARLKAKPGATQDLINHGEKWGRERGAATGQVAQYMFKLEQYPDEFLLVAAFTDRDAYRKNAEDPETNRLYQEMRALLVSDPEWFDGEVIETRLTNKV